jgi:hypothetical protein
MRGPKGQILKWRRKAELVRSSPYPRVMPPDGNELSPALRMTDAQLAEALRPIVLRGGHEYLGERSAKFVTRLREDKSDRRTHSFSPLVRAKNERSDVNKQQKSGIIGADNRVVRRSNTEYP